MTGGLALAPLQLESNEVLFMRSRTRLAMVALCLLGCCARGTARAQFPSAPLPDPASTDYLVGAMYFGGWESSTGRSPWDAIRPYPDRTPVLGYYDGASPTVADWEIKWALESGIKFFVYCWYRKKDNVGNPVDRNGIFLDGSIQEGLFHSKYRDQFKFAIMWENRQAGGVSSEKDLVYDLLPFWIENYFKKPGYLRVGGKPVLYIYGPEKLVADLGSVEASRKALDHVRANMRKQGFPGLMVFCENHEPDTSVMLRNRQAGCDVQFAYAVGPPWGGRKEEASSVPNLRPTPEQAIQWEVDYMNSWKQKGDIPFIATASMGWDPKPWQQNNGPGYLKPETMTRWRLSPEQFQTLLERIKSFMHTMPQGSLGRKMLLLDNWNEWAEGHFIAPNEASGFGDLKAVREVFTKRDNKPDYRSPFELKPSPSN